MNLLGCEHEGRRSARRTQWIANGHDDAGMKGMMGQQNMGEQSHEMMQGMHEMMSRMSKMLDMCSQMMANASEPKKDESSK